MNTRLWSYLSGAAAIAALALIIYAYRASSPDPLIFSPTQVLASSWYNYKLLYVDPSTHRTIDTQRDNITTSEGQSYTMLRAVWQGDQETFEAAWEWTQQNLAHKDDHLFSWIWGTRKDGSTGVLTEVNGQNSASDADADIALALVFAYARWQVPSYLTQARSIIRDIWNKEVVMIGDKPYMAANDIEKTAGGASIIVNPSYFNPAAYHIFALIDPAHPWESVRANAYDVLAQSAKLPLDAERAVLPPDWIRVDRKTGAITPASNTDQGPSFGFDALRIPFRIALDAQWFHNPDAIEALEDFSILSSLWEENGRLASAYSPSGSEIFSDETAAMYGGTLGYFMIHDPEAASAIYQKKLLSLYDATTGGWSPVLSYYDANWAWFGIALYNQRLPNLAERLPATAFIE